MKAVTIEMPQVLKCAAAKCAYNTSGACHAKAITIGDQINPDCDTFFSANAHTKNEHILAGVGACKVGACKFNKDYECTADSIRVGFSGENVQCLTYQSRA